MTAAVTELARAKVNLALHVVGRRADGYHELDSIVAFADIADRLTFDKAGHFEFAVTGPFASDVPHGSDNLVRKAAEAISEAFGRPMPVRIILEKSLPVAAGLGGGSADAAAALRGLAKILAIDCGMGDLHPLAMRLGSDVPVCLGSQACVMRGAGEIVEAIAGFRPRPAILVHPSVRLGTKDVFRQFALAMRMPAKTRGEIDANNVLCSNDLMQAAMKLAPIIADVIAVLEREPAVEQTGMSGSGAACFALFASSDEAEESALRLARDRPGWWCRATVLR